MPQTEISQINAWLTFILTLDDVIAAEKAQYPDESNLTAIVNLIRYVSTDNWPPHLVEYSASQELIKNHLPLTHQDQELLLTTLSQPLKDFTPEWEFQTEIT